MLAPVGGAVGARIRAVQERFDPKLARESPPHVTLAGSSGVGPIVPETSVDQLRAALAPIAATTAPLALPFALPHRFMSTNIVVLPLDPHGVVRRLHDRIAQSGLRFARAKFTFTPHATLSFYPTLSRDAVRSLLAMRFDEPAVLDRLVLSYTRWPQPAVTMLDLPLSGA